MREFDLGVLYRRVAERVEARSEGSYSARMVREGRERIAQKVGEEATEVVIAALGGGDNNRGRLCEESADLLYHLCLLWYSVGIEPDDVYAVLGRRAAEGDRRNDDGV